MKKGVAVLFVAVITLVAVPSILAFYASARPVRAAGGGTCYNGYFQGGYGFAGQGFTNSRLFGPSPEALEGGFIAIADLTPGATTGTLQGQGTISRRGAISHITFTGTFQITSRACGGSAVLTPATGAPLHFDFDMQQFSTTGIAQEINFIETDAGTTMTLTITHV